MKTHWDEIWEKTQEYKTSGWNGVIENWFQREMDGYVRGGNFWCELYEERRAWREESDRVHQVMLDWEAEQWTTIIHTALGGKEQTIRTRNK